MDAPILVVILLIVSSLILYILRGTKHTFPPGPRGLPLLGNIFDVPQAKPWLAYQRWSREYNSDIIHCNMAGNHIVILNSSSAAFDLLEKRSSIYSDRPRLTLLNGILDCNWTLPFRPYNDWWKEHRKMFHQFFNPATTHEFEPLLTRHVVRLLRRLLDTPEPEDLASQLYLMSSATMVELVYGFNATKEDDPHIVAVKKGMHVFSEITNGTYRVDSLPFLRYLPSGFPGTSFRKCAAVWKEDLANMIELPYVAVKASMKDNSTALPSMTMSLLSDLSTEEDSHRQELLIKEVVGSAYAGGSDTTSITLTSFVLAMIQYPNTQRKAHEELDQIIGKSRFPILSDRKSLPFITACVTETLRWRPLAPMAIAHKLTSDDIYEGYHLPKGSTVIGNVWAILHDERIYEDPDTYNPGRFLTKDGQLKSDAKATNSAGFGFGRRICPGRHFAEHSLWITIASLLWAFEIVKALDSDGNPIEPSGEVTSGLFSCPPPFRCRFRPRSHSVAEIARVTDLEA